MLKIGLTYLLLLVLWVKYVKSVHMTLLLSTSYWFLWFYT